MMIAAGANIPVANFRLQRTGGTIGVPVKNNGGNFKPFQAKISLNAGCVQTDGTTEVDQGGELDVAGTFEVDGGAVTNAGTIKAANDYTQTGGSTAVSGVFFVGGQLNQSGGTLGASGGTITAASASLSGGTFTLSGGTLASAGTVTIGGGGTFQMADGDSGEVDAASVVVASGGVFGGSGPVNADVGNADEVDVADGAWMSVNGSYTQTAGVTNIGSSQYAQLMVSGAFYEQGGAAYLHQATLAVGGGLQISAGASFICEGVIQGSVANAGLLQVGDGVTGVALEITGDFSQSSTGTLDRIFADTDTMNPIRIDGTATLGGELDVSVVGDPVWSSGGGLACDLIRHRSLNGAFATANLPGGLYLVNDSDDGQLQLWS